MEKEAEFIRRAVRARDKQRYSPELKARIIAYVEQRRAIGASQSTIAQEVGVKWMTLQSWLAKAKEPTALVPVNIREIITEPAHQLAIISPSGFRLEGLDADDAVALFRTL